MDTAPVNVVAGDMRNYGKSAEGTYRERLTSRLAECYEIVTSFSRRPSATTRPPSSAMMR